MRNEGDVGETQPSFAGAGSFRQRAILPTCHFANHLRGVYTGVKTINTCHMRLRFETDFSILKSHRSVKSLDPNRVCERTLKDSREIFIDTHSFLGPRQAALTLQDCYYLCLLLLKNFYFG